MDITALTIIERTSKQIDAFNFAVHLGILKPDSICELCHIKMSLQHFLKSSIDGFAWRCWLCKNTKSVRKDSVLKNFRCSIREFLLVILAFTNFLNPYKAIKFYGLLYI